MRRIVQTLTSSDLSAVQKTHWRYVVNRRETVLIQTITSFGSRLFRSLSGIEWEPRAIVRSSEGSYLYDAESLDRLEHLFSHGDIPLITAFSKRLVTTVSAFDRVSDLLHHQRFPRYSPRELVLSIDQFFDAALKAQTFLVPMPIAPFRD